MARVSRHGMVWLFYGSFILVTILRMFYTTLIPLTGDEAYFWVWSRHLAFGYYDHPPLVAWLIALSVTIGADTIFWIRLPAVLCLAGTTYLSYLLGRAIGGVKIGVASGLFGLACTAMTMMSVLVTTDTALILFWMWTVYLVWRAVQTRDGRYWYGAGLTLGLGMLSKFLIFPLPVGVLLFLLLSPADRFWLKRKEPYLAFILALLVFSPFVFWNSQHGWMTFAFNTIRHHWAFSLSRPLWQYFGLQAAMISPLLYLGLLRSGWCLFKLAAGGREGAGRTALFILFLGWILPASFFLQSFCHSTGVHWTIAGYGTALVGLAFTLSWRYEAKLDERVVLGPWLLATAACWTVVMVVLTLHPISLKGLSIKGHTVAEAYGWEELGRKVSALHHAVGEEYLVATKSYSMSSMISFYTPNHLYLGVLGGGSISGRSFDLWDRWGDDWIDRNVLYLDSSPVENGSGARILRETCEDYKVLAPIDLYRQGKVVRRVYPALGCRLKKDPYAATRRSYWW